MFGIDLDAILDRFDTRLDKLDDDMINMVKLLRHMDKTLTQILEIQQTQLDCSINSTLT